MHKLLCLAVLVISLVFIFTKDNSYIQEEAYSTCMGQLAEERAQGYEVTPSHELLCETFQNEAYWEKRRVKTKRTEGIILLLISIGLLVTDREKDYA